MNESLQRLQTAAGLLSPGKFVGAATRTGGFAVASARRAVHLHRRLPEVPVPRPTMGRLATVFAEELMLLTVAVTDPRIRDADLLRRVSEETDQALEHLEDNGFLEDPATYHERPDAPGHVDLEPAEFARIRYQTLSFESGYETRPGMPGSDRWHAVEANRRCYARVLEHRDGPRPWLVFLHGAGMGGPFDLVMLRALRYHRDLGFNVLAPVLPLHGARKHTGPGRADVVSLDGVANVHSLSQIVWDVRRCLAWIRERDAPSIVVHGMSLGGYAAALLAGLDGDLDAVIAGVPAATIHRPLIGAYSRDEDARRLFEQHDLLGERVEALHSVITPTAMACIVPQDRRFIYAGTADRLVTPNQPYVLWEHWDRPNICWTQRSHAMTMTSSKVRDFVQAAVVDSAKAGSAEPDAGESAGVLALGS